MCRNRIRFWAPLVATLGAPSETLGMERSLSAIGSSGKKEPCARPLRIGVPASVLDGRALGVGVGLGVAVPASRGLSPSAASDDRRYADALDAIFFRPWVLTCIQSNVPVRGKVEGNFIIQ